MPAALQLTSHNGKDASTSASSFFFFPEKHLFGGFQLGEEKGKEKRPQLPFCLLGQGQCEREDGATLKKDKQSEDLGARKGNSFFHVP